jgi:hypothetical protein
MVIDDIGQLEASETVRFGVDGSAYEIALSARQASELRSMAGRYISVARRVRPARQQHQPRPRARVQMDPEQSRRIRSWAMERGLLASPRGRIPQRVVDEYETAMRVASVPFRSPGTAEPEPAPSGAGAGKPAGVRGGEPGLTGREKEELRTIADAARPGRTTVAGRLRTRGLADRDSAGNWWLTDAGRRELKSA